MSQPHTAGQDGYRRAVLATVFVGTFMAPLDASIVNIAMPVLTLHFGAGLSRTQWVITAYLLTTSSLLLAFGRLADMRGHKRIYLAGISVFTAASALCGLAGSLGMLVAARVVQALGAACLMAAGPAILTDTFPPERRGRALGTLAVAVALGLTLGPSLGGVIVARLGWRWIFLVNIPVGILVAFLAARLLREKRLDSARRFDLAGALLALLALLSLLTAAAFGGSWGWGSPRTAGSLLLALLFLWLFISAERRVREPMLDLSLFSNRLFAAANASALANYVGMFSLTFLTPFYLIHVLGTGQERAGLVLTAVPLMTGLVAPFSGNLSDRIGSRLLSSSGLGITTLALAGLAVAPAGWGTRGVAAFLALAGLGSGIFQSPNTSAIMGSVPRHRLGIASGMQATMRNVGMVLGVAMAGAVVTTMAPAGGSDPRLDAAIRAAYLLGGAATAAGALASLMRGNSVNPSPVTGGP